MSVNKLGSHDIRLASSPSSPTTNRSFMLALDPKTGQKLWTERRVPPLIPRQGMGDVTYAQQDPLTGGFVFSQRNWADGALNPIWGGTDDSTYASADGCDARWRGVVTLGLKRSQTDIIVRNPGAETGTTANWTASQCTLTAQTAAKDTGSYGFRCVATGASPAMKQDLANPTVYRNKSIRLYASVRRTAGTGNVFCNIADDTASTSSSNTTSSSFVSVNAQRTINGTTNTVTVSVRADNSDTTFEVDDVFVISGATTLANMGSFLPVTYLNANLYCGLQDMVLQWSEANSVWDVVFLEGTNTIRDIVAYGANVYVAMGASASYVYGSGTTWNTSNLVAPADKAVRFAVVRNALWKCETATTDIKSSTNPVNGGSWSTVYTVGHSDANFTALYSLNDWLVVGKDDGMHIYLRKAFGQAADEFANVTNEFKNARNSSNFQVGAEWGGWLYLGASQQSLFRYNGAVLENISTLLFSPRLTDFGGKVLAMGADPAQLFMLLDTPTADTSASKTLWLVSLMERNGKPIIHTLATVPMGSVSRGALVSSGGYLYALGVLNYTTHGDEIPVTYRWTLPSKTPAPAFDASPVIASSGTLNTVVWDGGVPLHNKAFHSITVWSKGLDANHTITAKFGADGAANTSYSLTAHNTSPVQTRYFDTISAPETNAKGRTVQLQFAFSTNDTTSPQMFAFALNTSLRPDRVKEWEMFLAVGDGVVMRNGQPITEAKGDLIADIGTLEAQTYPIVMEEDLDGDNSTTTHRVQIVPGETRRAPEYEVGKEEGYEVWRVVMQEITLA